MELAPISLQATAGILVVFDPASNPRTALEHLGEALGLVIVVDNALGGHPLLADGIGRPANVRLLRNANRGGLAGAYNLALRLVFGEAASIRHVVFVDEDSDSASLRAFFDHAGTRRAMALARTAAVAPAHRDRATGLRARHLRVSRFRIERWPRDVTGLVPVAFVINSMSLWRVEALKQIGPYDEGLAVDQVDIDYCMRATLRGFEICLNGDCEFAHSIGRRRSYVVLGRKLQTGGHDAARRHMIGRNSMWLAKRYLFRCPSFSLLCTLRIGYEALGIALAETCKIEKLWQLGRGTVKGLFIPSPGNPSSFGGADDS